MEKSAKLSLETAQKLYNEGGAGKLFALDNYSEGELIKPPLPTSWKDLGEISGVWIENKCVLRKTLNTHSTSYSENRNIIPTEAQAKAVLALAQLLQLRDAYNGGVKVVLDGSKYIPCIFLFRGYWKSRSFCDSNYVFKFISADVRDEFLRNFKDNLLEEVKPLYM